MPQTLTLASTLPMALLEDLDPSSARAVIMNEVQTMFAAADSAAEEAGRKLDPNAWTLRTHRAVTGPPDLEEEVLVLKLQGVGNLIHVSERDVLRRRWYAVPETTIGGWALATADVEGSADIDAVATDDRVMAECWGEITARHLAELHNDWLDHRQGIDAAAIARLIRFSQGAFGPARRTRGILQHLGKELIEVQENPDDTEEWIDLLFLALDGAWRHGAGPEKIIATFFEKLAKNEARTWPDWRTRSEDEAIEHDRSAEVAS